MPPKEGVEQAGAGPDANSAVTNRGSTPQRALSMADVASIKPDPIDDRNVLRGHRGRTDMNYSDNRLPG